MYRVVMLIIFVALIIKNINEGFVRLVYSETKIIKYPI